MVEILHLTTINIWIPFCFKIKHFRWGLFLSQDKGINCTHEKFETKQTILLKKNLFYHLMVIVLFKGYLKIIMQCGIPGLFFVFKWRGKKFSKKLGVDTILGGTRTKFSKNIFFYPQNMGESSKNCDFYIKTKIFQHITDSICWTTCVNVMYTTIVMSWSFNWVPKTGFWTNFCTFSIQGKQSEVVVGSYKMKKRDQIGSKKHLLL